MQNDKKIIFIKILIVFLSLVFLAVAGFSVFMISWGFGSGVDFLGMLPAILLYLFYSVIPLVIIYFCINYLKEIRK